MNFNTSYFHLIISFFLLMGLSITTIISIVTISTMDILDDMDWWLQIITNFWVHSMLPLIIYIAFFTKFNNPFKKKND